MLLQPDQSSKHLTSSYVLRHPKDNFRIVIGNRLATCILHTLWLLHWFLYNDLTFIYLYCYSLWLRGRWLFNRLMLLRGRLKSRVIIISFHYYESSCIAFALRLIQDWICTCNIKWSDYLNHRGLIFIIIYVIREYHLILMLVIIVV